MNRLLALELFALFVIKLCHVVCIYFKRDPKIS